jgi:hypothetical protein
MATCWQCGRRIEPGTGIRKKVETGHSTDWKGFHWRIDQALTCGRLECYFDH